MQKKTVLILLAVFSSVFIILIITSFCVLYSFFGKTLSGRKNTVSKQEAKREIALYLNEKYSTDLFSSRHISVKKAMVGCGCDSDPLEFVGYTAEIKEIPNAPISPRTVWMVLPEQAAPFFTDDGQLDQVHRSLEMYLETNRISPDYRLISSDNGGFGTQWTPGKGFHAYFDGQDLSSFFSQEHAARSSISGWEADTYQYSVYFSIPDSQSEIPYDEFYHDMED